MHMYKIKEQKLSREGIDTLIGAKAFKNLMKQLCLLEMKHDYTAIHCNNVAEYMRKLAIAMELRDMEITSAYLSGLMHDIGKLDIPLNILNKPAKLDPREYSIIKKHAKKGYERLLLVDGCQEIANIILNHHERYDGEGYPNKMKGENIPLLARMLSICDSYDVITTRRNYKIAVSSDKAISELTNNMGTQFDPVICKIFIGDVLRNQEIKKISV